MERFGKWTVWHSWNTQFPFHLVLLQNNTLRVQHFSSKRISQNLAFHWHWDQLKFWGSLWMVQHKYDYLSRYCSIIAFNFFRTVINFVKTGVQYPGKVVHLPWKKLVLLLIFLKWIVVNACISCKPRWNQIITSLPLFISFFSNYPVEKCLSKHIHIFQVNLPMVMKPWAMSL